jgi:hypothetical protein
MGGNFMGRPSIFSKDYQRVMRRRKIIFRSLAVLAAFVIILAVYNRNVIPNLKKLAENFKFPVKLSMGDKSSPKDIGSSNTKQQSPGQYDFSFPNGDKLAILYEKKGEDIKLTGIKPDDSGIFFDIKDDGKAIVFDNPKTSDIFLFTADGKGTKLNSDTYKQVGDVEQVFQKSDILEKYGTNYIWAVKPKFLKDGRIVYQSNLPWFNETNNIFVWIVNSDGSGTKQLFGTGQQSIAKYVGFSEDGKLIFEFGGAKYRMNKDTDVQPLD